ncbi:MAG: hypothetical protein IJS61_04305 [Firmicutes bacterium]|nr:hypothetical protein [Bacillota bacterium]
MIEQYYDILCKTNMENQEKCDILKKEFEQKLRDNGIPFGYVHVELKDVVAEELKREKRGEPNGKR